MREQHQRIEELLRTQADPVGLTATVRAVMSRDIHEMASVAKLVAAGKKREDRNNQLSSLRVIMSRISKELGLQKITVIEHGTGYVVRQSVPKYTPVYGEYQSSVQQLADSVTHLSIHERQKLLEQFRVALGLAETKA